MGISHPFPAQVNGHGSVTYCADGYDYYWDALSDESTCEAYSALHHRTCCVPAGAAVPDRAIAPSGNDGDGGNDGDDDDGAANAAVFVAAGVVAGVVLTVCVGAAALWKFKGRRRESAPAVAHPTKDAARSPTVDLHEIRWATPRASGPVPGGPPGENPMAVA